MNRALVKALLSTALLSGCSCSTPLACTTAGDCPAGFTCVNGACEMRSHEEDAGGADAGSDAGGDGGLVIDAGPECACADVNGDGVLDASDADAATLLIDATPSACELLTADVDRDGAIDQLDAWLVAAVVEGRASAECGACEAGRACGDANDDGDVGAGDMSALISAIVDGSPLDPCTHISGDVVRDGVVDRRDVFGIRDIFFAGGVAEGACVACTSSCGDINQSGGVDGGDSVRLAQIIEGGEAEVCERGLADLNADGVIDARDQRMLARLTVGAADPLPRCPICSSACGDVGQDGAVSIFDVTRFNMIEMGGESTLCERDAADVNGDGAIDARDRRLVQAGVTGSVSTAGACLICSGVCGDLNRDGAVTAADRGVVTEIIGGRLPSPCELDDGDVDHDGGVDAADRDHITAIIAGTPPAMPCGR